MSSKYAYVGLLYGDSEYFLAALLYGFTLQKTNPKYDSVLMITPDIPKKQREVLSVYFKLIEVDYIYAHSDNFTKQDSRFSQIFTKMHLFNLDQYEKVLMLDIDIIVLHNLDHLFELSAPAAHYRNEILDHGSKVPTGRIYLKKGIVQNGINAGTMLLEPNKKEFKRIVKEIKNPLGYKVNAPEQEYLSYIYRDKWTHLDFSYLCMFDKDDLMKKYNYSIHDIMILQYAWILKPWDLVLDNRHKVYSILKKQSKDITYYTLWAHHYGLVKRILQNRGLDIDICYTKKNLYSDQIDNLYKKLQKY